MNIVFGFQRLAKEDYMILGRCPSWTTWNVKILLASFEMESSGEFEESREILRFNPIVDFDNVEGVEKAFHEKWGKWDSYIFSKICNQELPCSNPQSDDTPEPYNGLAFEDSGNCSIRPSSLANCLFDDIEAGRLTLNLKLLIEYLKDGGSAPSRVAVEIDQATLKQPCLEADSRESDSDAPAIEKNLDYVALGKETGAKLRAVREEATKYLIPEFEAGCSCNPKEAANRLLKVKLENGKPRFRDPRPDNHRGRPFIEHLKDAARDARRALGHPLKGPGYKKVTCHVPGHREQSRGEKANKRSAFTESQK